MKWKITFLDGSPDEEVEADSWNWLNQGWVHFVRKGNSDEKEAAAFHSNIVRSIRPVEGKEVG